MKSRVKNISPKELPFSYFVPLDDEEAFLMEAHKNNEYIPVKNSRERVNTLNAVLENIKKPKKAALYIRPNASSLQVIKNFAKKQKIPYQTFINTHIDKIAQDIENARIYK